ncbi:TylF/MycF/NovP-related O-methyltransferase [Nitrobacteraceae bacterium UC4446_H13]
MASILGRDKIASIRNIIRSVADVEGSAAECGVYRGGCLRLMATECPERRIYGFDTFEGLPADMWSADEPHSAGDFADCSFDAVLKGVSGLNVTLVKGVFPASAESFRAEKFAFMHLDFDFYESTKAALEWFLPRMSPGGVIVFDDYEWQHCPGVKRALDEAGLDVAVTVQFQAVHRVGQCALAA